MVFTGYLYVMYLLDVYPKQVGVVNYSLAKNCVWQKIWAAAEKVCILLSCPME